MSSVLRAHSQVETRIKFLGAIIEGEIFEIMGPISAIMPEDAFTSGTCPESGLTPGMLLRDLGKTVTTVNAAGLHTQTFRLVQQQAGGNSEGVNLTIPPFYVRVWAADPLLHPVSVVRLG
jgi:hypothetical protein